MSQMEYNKGKLLPTKTSYDNLFKELGGEPSNISEGYTKEEWCRDNCYDGDYEILNDKIYKVVWEVRRGEEPPELMNLTKHSDGSVDFETYHYNGGAHWTEIVEAKL